MRYLILTASMHWNWVPVITTYVIVQLVECKKMQDTFRKLKEDKN